MSCYEETCGASRDPAEGDCCVIEPGCKEGIYVKVGDLGNGQPMLMCEASKSPLDYYDTECFRSVCGDPRAPTEGDCCVIEPGCKEGVYNLVGEQIINGVKYPNYGCRALTIVTDDDMPADTACYRSNCGAPRPKAEGDCCVIEPGCTVGVYKQQGEKNINGVITPIYGCVAEQTIVEDDSSKKRLDIFDIILIIAGIILLLATCYAVYYVLFGKRRRKQ